MGSLRLLMRGGGEFRIRMDEDAAHRLKRAHANGEPADSVLSGSFLQLELDVLDAMEWIADSRQPSAEHAVDREIRRRAGSLMYHGWLALMAELAPRNSAYSVAGLNVWKAAALVLLTEHPELDDDGIRNVLQNMCLLLDEVANPEHLRGSALVKTLSRHEQRKASGWAPGGEHAAAAETASQDEPAERESNGDGEGSGAGGGAQEEPNDEDQRNGQDRPSGQDVTGDLAEPDELDDPDSRGAGDDAQSEPDW